VTQSTAAWHPMSRKVYHSALALGSVPVRIVPERVSSARTGDGRAADEPKPATATKEAD